MNPYLIAAAFLISTAVGVVWLDGMPTPAWQLEVVTAEEVRVLGRWEQRHECEKALVAVKKAAEGSKAVEFLCTPYQ